MGSERNGGYRAGGWAAAPDEVTAVVQEGVTYVTRDELHRWWLLDRALELLRTPKPKRGRGHAPQPTPRLHHGQPLRRVRGEAGAPATIRDAM